jgi:hypothetical protein
VTTDGIADAIRATLTSENVLDSNLENANVVDSLDRLATGIHRIADALERISYRSSSERPS